MSADDGIAREKGDLSDSKRRLIEQRLLGKPSALRASADAIPRRSTIGSRRASAGERWIYLAYQADPASSSSNITSSFRVRGRVDLALLEQSANRVVARHEILRSNFLLSQSVVEVIVTQDPHLALHTIRCDDEADLTVKAEEVVRRPFDLGSEPLVRLYYFAAPAGDGLLTLVVHDIVFDKWSLGLFWKETAAFYRHVKHGEPAAIADLALQYGDFAEWQTGWLANGHLDEQLQYWKARLAELPNPLPLPTDRSYPTRLTDEGRLERWRVGADVTAKLRRLAATENASLFMLLLAGFQILLHRYSGATDIVVGSPVANRRRKETADLIGFFLSTVALRTRLEGDPTAREILSQVRRTVLDAIENQDVSFDRVVEAVKPPRVRGRHPVFQTMFVYQRESEAAPSFDLGDVDLRPTYVETRTSKFDLTLFAAESGDGMETILEYRTDLFERETMHRMLRHYGQLLESMALEPDQRVSELSFLTEDERVLLFERWQGEKLPIDRRPDVIAQITAHAEASPQATAVVGAGRGLTYEQLQRASDSIARELRRLGGGRGRRIAHFMDRIPESVAAIVGILKAGASYVPIDPDYPQSRHRFVIHDSGIDTAVTTSALLPRIGALVPNTVLADHLAARPMDGPPAPPEAPAPFPDFDGQQAAYVIYTSGSTGEPKGVVVSHRNLLHSTEARIHYYAEPPKRFLLVPSFSFDSSIAVIFWTLATGGTLIIAGSEDLQDAASLRALIRDQRVSDVLCIPALYREVLRHGTADLQSLKRVILAGESCPPQLVTLHHECLPGVALFNEYGPTEVSVWATVHACTRADGDGSIVPIGRPISNTAAYVLDSRLQPLPVGITGELCLAGEGLSLGYHGREELTRERFIVRDLPVAGSTPIFRTGDRARWRSDGVLEFLGRQDDQLKLRGYRIEPGEIESALERHPDIECAVVVSAAAGRDRGDLSEWDELTHLASRTPSAELEALLAEITALSPETVRADLDHEADRTLRADHIVTRDRFRVELHSTAAGFVAAPRKAQRDWLVGRAMEELANDLEHLDRTAPSLVHGFDHHLDRDLHDISQTTLTDQQIMEDWQIPLMKAMARHVTDAHGEVLEVGFGRGVSAELIQELGVISHSVIEPNEHSVRHYFEPWRQRHADRDIRLFHARWQDVEDRLGLFDGIFFHAFPMNEREFSEYVLRSVTFAEHAFGAMASHLGEGGVFTYLTTELDSLSRGHQRSLLRHFRSISMHVEKLQVPDDTRDTWWANSMVVVKAVK